MAPSRWATSITWSVGTKRNSASWSINFLISQGQATRSTLTCSRVIHFMEWFSFVLHQLLLKKTTSDELCWLLHLTFLIDGDTTTRQKDVESLPLRIVGRGMSPHFGQDLFID